MKIKKHNLVYQITNIINGKSYIGRHITNNLDDGYMGSGDQIQKAIRKYGIENFQKEVLFDFDNPEEMITKENELLTEDFVNRNDVYNLVIGGSSGMIGKTHNEATREILRKVNTGIVSVKDEFGNNFKVSKDDPRYLSGELKHNTFGTICVKDAEGNKFRVPSDDPRWISGELVGVNQGIKQDSERIENRVKKNIEWWKTNTHTDQALQKMKNANKGKVTVRDVAGNIFRVGIDDRRLQTGELVNNYLGKKMSESFKKKISKNKKYCVWISNIELLKTKLIRPDELDEYLELGWIKFRCRFNKPNWELKLQSHLENQIKSEEI